MATEALLFERLTTLDSPELVSARARPAPAARIDLGGTQVDRIDRQAALERIDGFLRSGQPHQVVTANLDFLSIAERDHRFRGRQRGRPGGRRRHAAGVALALARRAAGGTRDRRRAGRGQLRCGCQTGHGVFLLGAGPGIAATAAERLKERHPGLRIVGTYSPPMGPLKRKESERLVRMIREAAPGFLFVALGAPRQDIWIRDNLRELNVPVAMGVGCVFDLLAGVSSRAPRWMQTDGLEWAYRLLREPRRLWRRYLERPAAVRPTAPQCAPVGCLRVQIQSAVASTGSAIATSAGAMPTTEPSQAFGHVGSAVLVVASVSMAAALWLASGMQPLPYPASRMRSRFPCISARSQTDQMSIVELRSDGRGWPSLRPAVRHPSPR